MTPLARRDSIPRNVIHRSPYPDVAIPDRPLTEWLLESAERRPQLRAFIEGPSGRTLTFGDWARLVRRGAGALSRRGLGKGDVFGIYSPNLPEYAVLFHAVSLAGGITTTANPLLTSDELAVQLRDAGFDRRVGGAARRAAQEGARGGVDRPDPEVGVGEDPAAGARRARARPRLRATLSFPLDVSEGLNCSPER